MWRAAFLPWPTPTVTVRSSGTMSPPAKIPGWPVIMFGADLDHAVLDLDARHAVEQRQVGVLAEREHHGVRLQLLELAGGLGEAGLVELHLLDHELALVGLLDGGEPAHHHALLLGLLDLEVVGGHALARAPVDDDRLLGARAAWRCGRRPSRCCRRRRRPRGGRASASPRPPCCAAPRGRPGCARTRRRGCRRACEMWAPTARKAASKPPSRMDSSMFVTLRFSSSFTPMSRMRCTSASSTSRGSRYLGMPKRIMPAGHRARPRGSSPRGRAG